jgi:SAM-dependent methyltransferase
MSFYEEIADYYDLIFPFNKAHVGFVKNCIEEPYRTKTVLDVGCGTGDLVIALADIGFHAVGIDYDANMLHKAGEKMYKETTAAFNRLDMREIAGYFTAPVFDGVFCFGNTLVHLTGLSEIEIFCKDVKTALKDKGKFLLQILNYDHILDQDIKSLPLIENNVIIFERFYEYDNKKNLIEFRTVLTVRETGKIIENTIPLYPLRKQELDEALKKAGFTDVSYYGDFDKRELKEDSLPLVAEAKGRTDSGSTNEQRCCRERGGNSYKDHGP